MLHAVTAEAPVQVATPLEHYRHFPVDK